MEKISVKIGARGSKLAMIMAEEVRERLIDFSKACQSAKSLRRDAVEIKKFVTQGDRIQNKALIEFGGKGLFTKEISQALLKQEIDIAVHSAKDMPGFSLEKLKIAGYLPREDNRDCFLSRDGKGFFDLPKNSVIGTSALRRQALIKKLRKDLRVILLRGNVDTRIKKIQSGEIDGTFLAMAGLKRMKLEKHIAQIMDKEIFPPAPGQGAICLEIREENSEIEKRIAPILDEETAIQLACERQFLITLEGSCRTPLACYTNIVGEKLFCHAEIFLPDGSRFYKLSESSTLGEANALGKQIALDLKKQAGENFFHQWHS